MVEILWLYLDSLKVAAAYIYILNGRYQTVIMVKYMKQGEYVHRKFERLIYLI